MCGYPSGPIWTVLPAAKWLRCCRPAKPGVKGIEGTAGTGGRGAFRDGRGSGQDLSYGRYTKPSGTPVIDINTADTTAFIALRGHWPGHWLSRIVHFREKLGGFHAVEQVGRDLWVTRLYLYIRSRTFLQCVSPVLYARSISIHAEFRWL